MDAVLVPVRRLGCVVVRDHVLAPRVVGQALGLDEPVGDVDAEAGHTAVEPEAQDRLELLADLGVLPVEVGLGHVEEVEVPLAGRSVGLGDPRPGWPPEDRAPVVRRLGTIFALPLPEHVPRPLGRAGPGGERGLEPGVLARGVVRDEVDDDLDPELVGPCHERFEVLEVAEEGVDVAVVGDVVSGVVLRRDVEGGEPHRVDAEGGEVGETLGDAGQVTDAVAVAVGPAAWVDLVDHGVAPPGGIGGGPGVQGGGAQGQGHSANATR